MRRNLIKRSKLINTFKRHGITESLAIDYRTVDQRGKKSK